jgi:NAD(P)H-dependent flavin oxidoreductase YrpB (nitropropane dioxygenase family)
MASRVQELTGVDFPLFAFSHCRDVVAAVSRAGGFGVLGGSSFTPDTLDAELRWLVDHCGGRPFGVDLLIPEHLPAGADRSPEELATGISRRHRDFVRDLLVQHGVACPEDELINLDRPKSSVANGEALLEIAFRYPIKLIANALGIAPPRMIELGKAHGVAVAALVGAKEHAVRQVEAGVDILVAQGGEAGGHCGEVSTLVLVPEVLRAVQGSNLPVLAAGGIMTGAQMAGCMAMGAQGAWTGSIWLSTVESGVGETFQQKMVAASSRDTVRSNVRTGKPSRQLRSAWHEAWNRPDAPAALPMPLMGMISQPAFERIEREADRGLEGAKRLMTYFVGQGVGLVDQVRSAGSVVQEFKVDFAAAVSNLMESIET